EGAGGRRTHRRPRSPDPPHGDGRSRCARLASGSLRGSRVTEAVVVHGASLAQAFIAAVLGLFARGVDLTNVESRDIREVRAHGDSPETLLAHWIAECCYVHELEGFVFRSIELARFDVEARSGAEPMRLHAFLHGETLDPVRHPT